jgi:hypothetical protein
MAHLAHKFGGWTPQNYLDADSCAAPKGNLAAPKGMLTRKCAAPNTEH